MATALSLPATLVNHSRYSIVVMCHNCCAPRAVCCLRIAVFNSVGGCRMNFGMSTWTLTTYSAIYRQHETFRPNVLLTKTHWHRQAQDITDWTTEEVKRHDLQTQQLCLKLSCNLPRRIQLCSSSRPTYGRWAEKVRVENTRCCHQHR